MSIIRKPKIIQSFVHTFADDINTSSHFLPWSDEIEEGASSDGRWFYPMPFSSMRLLKVIMRYRTLAQGFNMEVKYGTIEEGQAPTATSWSSNMVYANTRAVPATSNSSVVFDRADFSSGAPAITQTTESTGIKMIGIRIQADLDPGSSNEWYFTSIWECKL